ncbi:MAG: hypothetical protein PUK49_10580 [Oscillospiraceae bacterium]|nr:hypothetical protein [Oscillospiraceae bacterium]
MLEELFGSIAAEEPIGGTDIYSAAEKGIEYTSLNYNLSGYCPAVILMTDGASKTDNRELFKENYRLNGEDIPIFSILFGEAEDEQLNELAQLSNARVFDGRNDLIGAFRSVKGYN